MKKKIIITLSVIGLLIVSIVLSFVFMKLEYSSTVDVVDSSCSFELHMLDVGQGLSLFVREGDHCLVYDGGGREKSSYVVSYLKSQGVSSLDYVIASHYDEDHIAGLVGVLNVMDVDTVLCPDYESDTEIYSSFVNKLNSNVVHPSCGDLYKLGNATIEIISSDSTALDENDRSIVIRITCGKTSILVTGDASSSIEDSLSSNIDSDVLVLGHHGSQYSSSEDFLRRVNPSYVFISCGINNDYGHPSLETMSRLMDLKVSVFRTDLQQEVVLYSDGESYSFSKDPCDNYEAGSVVEEIMEPVEVVETEFVVNTRSMIIHKYECESVSAMAEHNKWYTNDDIETLVALGYECCQNCLGN